MELFYVFLFVLYYIENTRRTSIECCIKRSKDNDYIAGFRTIYYYYDYLQLIG